MSKENRKLWADALRSGKYAQGIGYLQSEGRYCCLGVACEVYIERGGILKVKHNTVTTYDGKCGVLPEKVYKWLGLPSLDPVLNTGGEFARTSTATGMNDDGYTFNEIADAIEQLP